MLTEEQLEYISEALIPLFDYLEKEVIVDIAVRLKETLAYSRTAELEAIAMRELGYSPARIRKEAMRILKADKGFRKAVAKNTLEHKKTVRNMLREIMKAAGQAIGKIFKGTADMAWADNLSIWIEAGKKLTDDSYLPKLVDTFTRQTKGTFDNLTGTTGFKMMSGLETLENVYVKELDKACIKICSGTFSRDKVVAETIHELAQSGLRTVDFASGYSMQLDTAVRLALRTGAHQIAAKIMDKDILNTGENLVYVSEHWGARNKGSGHANHEEWQGKVYFIRDGKDYSTETKRIGQDRILSLWYATGYSVDGTKPNDPLGLHGYNCRHNHYVWFEGVSSLPDKNPEPAPVTMDGKTYDYYAMTQKMRSMERNIRAMKKEREALKKLGMDTDPIQNRIKQKTKAYLDFCEKCKIKDKSERLRYESGTADLNRTKAWKRFEKDAAESELKNKLPIADEIKQSGSDEMKWIGQIDPEKRKLAVEYYGNLIRESEIEHLYVIDKKGNVYYNSGKEDAVDFGKMNLTDCIILHNHPVAPDVLSFGNNDFVAIRDSNAYEWYLVNKEYDYYAKKIKSMDELAYNPYYQDAMKNADKTDDLQHYIFESLKKEGYVRYERKKINRGSKETD